LPRESIASHCSNNVIGVILSGMGHDGAGGLKKMHEGGGDEHESITVHEVPLKRVEAWLRKKEREGAYVGPRIYAGLYFINKYNEPHKSKK